MEVPKEAGDRTMVDHGFTEDFLNRYNLKVTTHFENAPTLVWSVELNDNQERSEPPIVLTLSGGKEHDIVSIRVNRSFSEFSLQQQILSAYYMGEISTIQGSLNEITLSGGLGLPTGQTILDVISYSRQGDWAQLMQDISHDGGWFYNRVPLNS